MKLTSREIAALELSVAVAWDGRLKPKSDSQRQMIRDDAKAAIDKMRRLQTESGK